MSNARNSFLVRYSGVLALSAAIALPGLVYYGGAANAEETTPPPAPPQAPQVEVATLQAQELRDWSEYSGRLAAVESAAIKPLVGGTITRVLFEDGQTVEKGDPLFIIDPRPYENAEAQALASLATARSQQKLAQDEFSRSEKLHGNGLISDSVFDNAANALQVADAGVLQAESALKQARLDLDYAHIKAPIAGRISRAELTVGNVVEAGPNAPVLASIVADEELYAEFNVDEQSYIRYARDRQHQRNMPVELTLAQDDGEPYRGSILAFDNRLNSASGTIRARAVIDNRDGLLTPGLYVNVRMGSAQKVPVLLVPERAIGTNQSHKFVYVIDAGNTVKYREISLGRNFEGQRVVLNGLEAGEQIIVNGISHIAPGMPVRPVPAGSPELLVSR